MDAAEGARTIAVARLALGALFSAAGLRGFLGFLPLAPPHAFQVILIESGWMRGVMAVAFAAGLPLLSNRFVPFALALLAPDVAAIALYRLLLDPALLGRVPVIGGLEAFLPWSYRGSFRGVLARDARPGA